MRAVTLAALMRRLLHRLIQCIYALVFATVLWLGFYASSHGFSRKWRTLVTQEFRKRGVDVSMQRLTLDPLHGLVAREVRIIDPRRPGRAVAVINRVVLDLNYSNLIRGGPFLNAVDLQDANLALPLDPGDPDSERVEISRLNARLLLPPEQLYLSEAEARVYGIQVSARGRLLNPQAWKIGSDGGPNAQSAQRQQTLSDILSELRTVSFLGTPPRIEIEFSGDLAEPATLFAEATIAGQNIRRGGYQIENILATLRYREAVCSLTRCTVTDARGKLEASASYDFATKRADGQLRSTLDLQGLAHSLRVPHVLDEAVFYDPPALEISAQALPGDPMKVQLTGRASLKKFAVKSVVFDGASASFSYDGARWYVRDFSLRNRTGAVALNALQVPGSFRARLQSTLDPRTLLPLLSGPAATLLGDWDFVQSPHFDLAASGPTPDIDKCEALGAVKLGRTRLRGVPLNSASATMRVKNKVVSFEDFKVVRDEGTGTGTFRYDFAQHEASLDQIRTHLNVGDVATWIGLGLPRNLAPYRFRGAPDVVLNGHVGADRTKLNVAVNAPGGMDYTFLKKVLPFPRLSGNLLFTEGRLQISDLAGTLYAGRLRGNADISLKRDSPGYAAKISAENVDFESLTKLYFNYQNSRGLLSGAFDFRGRGDDARTLQGRGQVAVVNGNVFAIPVLGPLSGILNSIVPGMGYNTARRAGANFEVGDGVISTQNFLVQGSGFSMLGGGRIFFLEDKIDFNIRLNAQGLPGVLLFPVSKLLEYVADGTLAKPGWRLKRLPSL